MKIRLLKLFFWYFSKGALPHWFILFIDSFVVVGAGFFAQILHVNSSDIFANFFDITVSLCCYLLAYLIGFRIMRTYSSIIRYSSFVDLYRIAMANFIGVTIVAFVRLFIPIDQVLVSLSWQVLFISFIVGTAGMWGLRILVKYIFDICFVSASAQKVFIYGVKEGGIALARSIHSQGSQFVVTGFVSDDSKDWQHILMGTKIYPNNENLVAKMRQKGATVLMVSPLKTECLRDNRQMIDSLAEAGIKIMVHSSQEWDGKSDLSHTQLKEIDIEDLLPRNQIEVDLDAIGKILTGKCVMITGAAGSIGSEIVRQVASFKPHS